MNVMEKLKSNQSLFSITMLLILAVFYIVSVENFASKNSEKTEKIASLTKKLNATYEDDWVKFSKLSEANAFVFETYYPCASVNHSLLCRSAAVHLATLSHGGEFGKKVDQSILESIKTIRLSDEINNQIKALSKQ